MIKYNSEYYIRTSEPYYIIIKNYGSNNEDDYTISCKKDKLTCEKINKDSNSQLWYLWVDMINSNKILLSNSETGLLWYNDKNNVILKNTIKENKGGLTQNNAKKAEITKENIFNINFYDNDVNSNFIGFDKLNLNMTTKGEFKIGSDKVIIEWKNKSMEYVIYPGNTNNLITDDSYFKIWNDKVTGYFEFTKSNSLFHIKNLNCYFTLDGKYVKLNSKYLNEDKQLWYFMKDNFNRFVIRNIDGKFIDINDGHKMTSKSSAKKAETIYLNDGIHTNRMFAFEKIDLYKVKLRLIYNENINWVISGNNKKDYVYYEKDDSSDRSISIYYNQSSELKLNQSLFITNETSSLKPVITEAVVGKNESKNVPTGKKITLTKDKIDNIKTTSTKDLIGNYFKTITNKIKSKSDSDYEIKFDKDSVFKCKLGPINESKNEFTNLKSLEFKFEPGNKINWSKIIFNDNSNSNKLLSIFKSLGSKEFKNNDYIIKKENTKLSDLIKKIYIEKTSDYSELECLGWNRYRPNIEQIEDEISYFNFKFSEFVDNVLAAKIYNRNIDLTKSFKELFIVNNKLLKYVLYSGLFDQIMGAFGIDFLDYVPTLTLGSGTKNEYLPYWNSKENYFAKESSDKNNKIYWSINSGSDSKNDYKDDNNINIIYEDRDKNNFDNVFAIYGNGNKLSYKLQNGESTTNKDDFDASLIKLADNTKGLIVSATIDDNYKPYKTTAQEKIGGVEDKYKFNKNIINNCVIGSRSAGCQRGENKTTKYSIVLAVTEIGKLKNTGGNAVDCGPCGEDSGGSDCHIGSISSYYNFPTRVSLFVYDNTGKCVSYTNDVGKAYYLEYLKFYAGFGKYCYEKNGKGGKGKCTKSGATRYPGTHPWIHWCTRAFDPSGDNTVSTSDTFMKCNLETMKTMKILTIGDKNFSLNEKAIENKLSEEWCTIEGAGLIDTSKRKIGKCTYDIYASDDAWIRIKNEDKTYLKSLFNSNNYDKTYKLKNQRGDEIICYGNQLEIPDVASEVSNVKYSGNVITDVSCDDNIRINDSKIYTLDKTDPKARCFVKTDSKTIRIFDERVDKLIMNTINDNLSILTTRLTDEIMNHFNDNTLQLLPYRLLKKYIPTLCMDGNNIKSNLENIIGPILFNIPSPLLTDYKYYIAGYYNDFKSMLLKCYDGEKEFTTNGISHVLTSNDNHYVDNMIVEIGNKLSNINNVENKALVLSLETGINSIYKYIDGNKNMSMYDIDEYDINNELSNALNDNKIDRLKIIISKSEINKYSDKIVLIGSVTTPGIFCYSQNYDEYSDVVPSGESYMYSNYVFKYGMNKFYIYRNKTTLSLTSDSDAMIVGSSNKSIATENVSNAKSSNYQACVIDAQVGEGLKTISNWLKPYWYPAYNLK